MKLDVCTQRKHVAFVTVLTDVRNDHQKATQGRGLYFGSWSERTKFIMVMKVWQWVMFAHFTRQRKKIAGAQPIYFCLGAPDLG